MTLLPEQIRMARAALKWSVRDLATKAKVGVETVSRAEKPDNDIKTTTLGAFQRAFEEAGIEFKQNSNAVELHSDLSSVAFCADPSMPLGVRRVYPR